MSENDQVDNSFDTVSFGMSGIIGSFFPIKSTEIKEDKNSDEQDCKDQLFVAMSDNIPIFYTTKLEDARNKVKDMANHNMLEYGDYHCFLQYKSQDELDVIGYHKNYIISHPRLLHSFIIKKVPKIDEVK